MNSLLQIVFFHDGVFRTSKALDRRIGIRKEKLDLSHPVRCIGLSLDYVTYPQKMGENIWKHWNLIHLFRLIHFMISHHFSSFFVLQSSFFPSFSVVLWFLHFPWFATGVFRSCGPAIRVGPQTRRFCWENGDRVAWCLFVCWFLDVFVGQKGYCSVAALQCFLLFFSNFTVTKSWRVTVFHGIRLIHDSMMVTWLKAKPS